MRKKKITHHSQLTGAVLKARRLELGMNQTAFWAPAETSSATGSNYETGVTRNIPGAVLKCMFQAYYQAETVPARKAG